jgi:hypothetical protein
MLWFAQGSTNSRKHFAAIIALEISSRNAHVAALQKRWDRLRAGLDLILDQRGGTWPICRRRQRVAGARRGAGKLIGWWPASTPTWSRWSPNSAPGRRGAGPVEDLRRGAQSPRRPAGGDHPGPVADR